MKNYALRVRSFLDKIDFYFMIVYVLSTYQLRMCFDILHGVPKKVLVDKVSGSQVGVILNVRRTDYNILLRSIKFKQ